MQTITPILIDASLKGLAILLMGTLVTSAMRRSSAAARHLVWTLAVLAVLAMPLLSTLLPGLAVLPVGLSVTVPDIVVEPVASSLAEIEAGPPLIDEAAPRSSASPSPARQRKVDHAPPAVAASSTGPQSPHPGDAATRMTPAPADGSPAASWWQAWLPWLPWVWLGGALFGLIPLALGWLSLWHLQRTSEPVSANAWQALLEQLRNKLGLKRPVALLRSLCRTMPMTWGMLPGRSGAVVLIPEGAEAWSAERRRAVLLHELAHIKRRDCLPQMLTQVACALHWFNPLIWFAAHRMLIERERACDDLALRHETKASDYAQHLLDIAAGPPAEAVGFFAAHAGIAMARRSKLEGRVAAILDKQRNRGAMTRLGVAITVTLIGAIVLPLAMLRSNAPFQPNTIITRPGYYPGLVADTSATVDTINSGQLRLTFHHASSGIGQEPFAASEDWMMSWDDRGRLWVYVHRERFSIRCYSYTKTGSLRCSHFDDRAPEGVPPVFLAQLPGALRAKFEASLSRLRRSREQRVAAGIADDGSNGPTFADRVARTLTSSIAALETPIWTPQQRERLTAGLEAFVDRHDNGTLLSVQRERILTYLPDHVPDHFGKYGAASDMHLLEMQYLSIPDWLQTLQWKLWLAMRREPLSVEQRITLQDQLQWLQQKIGAARSLGSPYSTQQAVERLEQMRGDPLVPLFKRPLDDAQWRRLRDKIEQELVKPGHHAFSLLNRAAFFWLTTLHEDGKDFDLHDLPYDDRVYSWGVSGSRGVHLGFASNAPHRGNTLGFGTTYRGAYDVMAMTLELGARDGTTDELLDSLASHDQRGDVMIVDENGPVLRAVRQARLARLEVANWLEADARSDDDLRRSIKDRGITSLPIQIGEADVDGWPFNSNMFVAVQTKEGGLSVLRIKNVHRTEEGALAGGIHIRPRPLLDPVEAGFRDFRGIETSVQGRIEALPVERDEVGRPTLQWRVDWPKQSLLRYGWFTLVDGVKREHGGGGRSSDPQPGHFTLALHHMVTQNGQLSVTLTRKPADGDGWQAAAGTIRTDAPANATFRVRHLDQAAALQSDAYQTFWRGEWIRNGEVVKAIIYAVRLAEGGTDDSGGVGQNDAVADRVRPIPEP